MSRTVLVPPRIPSLSSSSTGDLDAVSLAEYDLWMNFVKNVHVIPSEINIDSFSEALAIASGIYRHVCGRLVSDEAGWKIRLSDSPIPLEIIYPSAVLGIENEEQVVQDDLSTFMSPSSSRVVNTNSPLLIIRLTISSEKTAIGISWHHTLGDATSLMRFMHLVSQMYQRLPSEYPPPTFGKHLFPVANHDTLQKFRPLMPHLTDALSPFDVGVKYQQRNRYTVRVNWIIGRAQAESLRTRMQASSRLKLSVQDCLSAYVVTLLNRCGRQPIDRVTNATSYRDLLAPFIHPDVAGNEIYVIPTEQMYPNEAIDIRTVAQKIRASLIEARQPRFIEDYMSVASVYMLSAANDDKRIFFGAEPSALSVNSNLSLDWHSIHFGHPGHAQFFTVGVSKYYLRVFKANPTSSGLPRDAIDISFGVPAHLESRVLATIRSDFANDRWPENVIHPTDSD